MSCKSKTVLPETPPIPVISFQENHLNLGTMKRGEKKEVEFVFTNTGKADLLIEFVTSCKCTSLNWPREPILPGESGRISVVYDSTDQPIGPLKKTVDIIANTEPIVVEAFFEVVIQR
ncbi:MAG: DUF1573 domain-containing protein [Saprospiraceae bacterium]|nr:DUF1573 domain-containing protein [Saprospiraceae bacterium]